MKVVSVKKSNTDVTFDDVKRWYEENLAPDVIDFDDQRVYEYVYHGGRWAGIFQLTSTGAQRLFTKAEPRSIIDIATLTSIYRPGPLAANVDKLYVKAKRGESYEWPDPRIGEILAKTEGMIIFQEQVMELAEKCAGFPKEECDQVRRAIMKRSISGGEAAKKKAQETRDAFVNGCIENGYTKAVADDLYDKILYFAGYGFNKSLYLLQPVNIYNLDGTIKATVPIEAVQPNDLLLSRDESTGEDILVTVLDKHDHGTLDLVEVELTTGEKIRCTMDHKFRTVETGEMLPLWLIEERGLSIVTSVDVTSASENHSPSTSKDAT